MASSGEDSVCNDLKTPNTKTHERHSLKPAFGLSNFGCCRNMAVQNGGFQGRRTVHKRLILGQYTHNDP